MSILFQALYANSQLSPSLEFFVVVSISDTVDSRFITVQYNTMLHTSRLWSVYCNYCGKKGPRNTDDV